MGINRKVGFIAVYFGAVFLLFACDGSQPYKDLRTYIDQLKQSGATKPTAGDEKEEKLTPPATAAYQSDTRRSPFEVMEAAPAKGRVSSNPLQAFPLDMLRFVGTVTKNSTTVAFVSAPDNRIYEVKVGDVIGDRDSEVVTIDSDRISLTENYSENGKSAMKRVVTIQLKEASQ